MARDVRSGVRAEALLASPGWTAGSAAGQLLGARIVLPGLLLCVAVTIAAILAEHGEARLLGRAWLEALVVAILIGTLVRSTWTPGARWMPGVQFCAKTLLEVAVVLLGASISVQAIMAAGAGLLGGVATVVVAAIAASYGIGRALGLPHRMATLIACGNSICGNSAIAAIAPIIGADGEDVAASIAFTAVLGVGVVLTLPMTVPLLHLSGLQYGALVGLTVYAVPQVLAATAPVGSLAVQFGTLIKLVRVLMLGPVVLALSLLTRRMRDETGEPAPGLAGRGRRPGKLPLHKLVPWFIVGFLLLAALRSAGVIPAGALAPIGMVANGLTVISMAALGLCTDLRVVGIAGIRVTAAVTLSLLVLGAISLGLIRLLGVA